MGKSPDLTGWQGACGSGRDFAFSRKTSQQRKKFAFMQNRL
jgi:hypothetical protein